MASSLRKRSKIVVLSEIDTVSAALRVQILQRVFMDDHPMSLGGGSTAKHLSKSIPLFHTQPLI
jgi:hypothetical protein